MATTLVIKSANFAVNKLTTVTLNEQIPCIGIELDYSTLTINYISSGTLTAIVSPNDTTDPVSWASSDTDVATVSNGIITPVGIGAATITATCGSFSASCSVSITANMNTPNRLNRVGYYMSGNATQDDGNGLPTWSSASAGQGGLGSTTGTLSFYGLSDIYPYAIPKNTEQVKITIPRGSVMKPGVIECFNSETAAASSSTTARLLIKINISSTTPTTDASGNSVYMVDVPTNTPIIDMIAISFLTSDYSDMTSAQLEAITVEFLPAAS